MDWTEMPLPTTNISKVEDFPVLGTKTKATKKTKKTTRRSSSALSSVSTTSIGAFQSTRTEVTWKLENGLYFNTAEIWVRPFLSCRCNFCKDRSRNPARPDYLKEEDWEYCEKVDYKCGCYALEVTKSKVVHHRTKNGHEKFSVAYVEGKNGNRIIRGWVRSKNLKRRQGVRNESTLKQRAIVAHRLASEVDRSRSPSVCSSATSMIPPPLYQFGEVVLCRIQTGEWVKGEVRCEHPLEILTAGNNRSCRFRFNNVKKHPVRTFVALEDIEVRTVVAKDRWNSKCTLKRGTSIDVAYLEGFEGRITAPVCGWITMRNKHSLSVVDKDYVFAEREPTLLINNVPGNLTERQLVVMIQQNAYVSPTSIQFQQNGNQFRAVVQFRTHAEGVGLVELGEVCLDGKHRLVLKWEMNYLRSRALANNESSL